MEVEDSPEKAKLRGWGLIPRIKNLQAKIPKVLILRTDLPPTSCLTICIFFNRGEDLYRGGLMIKPWNVMEAQEGLRKGKKNG